MFCRRSSRRRSAGPIIAADHAILRDLVNATVGSEELAAELYPHTVCDAWLGYGLRMIRKRWSGQ